jgi:hypothetical protein
MRHHQNPERRRPPLLHRGPLLLLPAPEPEWAREREGGREATAAPPSVLLLLLLLLFLLLLLLMMVCGWWWWWLVLALVVAVEGRVGFGQNLWGVVVGGGRWWFWRF